MTTTHSNITALFSDIADKIRFKRGTTSSYVADAFPTAIEAIGENWVNKTITTFPLSSGYSGVIGSYAFYYCNQMSGVAQTNSTLIYSCAFAYCSKLTTLSFPNVTSVSTAGFSSCTSVTTVSFPNLTYVGTYAFAYCTYLTSATFSKLTSVASYAFDGMYRLKSVSLPLVKSVYNYGMAYCSSLTTISLPSCTYMAANAFRNCIRLVSLYLMGSSVCSLGASTVFYSTPIGGYSTTAGQFGSVYVPSSLYATYIASTYWSLISSRIVSV